MGTMIGIVISLVTSLIAGVIYSELSARASRMSQGLLERAVLRLPKALRARYREEWFAYLHDQPTPLSALLAAFGLLVAAERVRAPGGVIWTRLMDRMIALGMIIFLLPIFAIVSLTIRILDGGPAIIGGEHSAPDGKVFYLRRFRTLPHQRGDGRTLGEIISHPTAREYRMLKFGRFLRKGSIDVLPEFINVLFGDMSIVGPRPRSARFRPLTGEEQPQVRPGITGISFLHTAAPDHGAEYSIAAKKAEDRFRDAMEENASKGIRMWLMGIGRTFVLIMRGPRR